MLRPAARALYPTADVGPGAAARAGPESGRRGKGVARRYRTAFTVSTLSKVNG